MKRHKLLHEISKIAIGLVIADLVSVIWLGARGFFPLTMLGVTWTSAAVWPIVAFDASIILLLAHYAWHTRLPASPRERTLLYLAGAVFLVVCILHLLRLMFGWGLILGSFAVPVWLSWFGAAITAYLSYASFHFALRGGK